MLICAEIIMSKPVPLLGGEEDNVSRQLSTVSPPVAELNDMNSPLHTFPTDIHTELEEFRDNWQRELNSQSGTITPNRTVEQKQKLTNNVTDVDQHKLAENLFRSAVELEQRGKVYDAVPLYRKAVQIVPDIEFKYYELQKKKSSAASSNYSDGIHSLESVQASKERADEIEDNEEIIEDLYEKFQLDLASADGRLLQSSRDPSVISTETHISELPPEILLYILRWVVSAQLDMLSLEQCASVCKGLYLCARDEELWRLACAK